MWVSSSGRLRSDGTWSCQKVRPWLKEPLYDFIIWPLAAGRCPVNGNDHYNALKFYSSRSLHFAGHCIMKRMTSSVFFLPFCCWDDVSASALDGIVICLFLYMCCMLMTHVLLLKQGIKGTGFPRMVLIGLHWEGLPARGWVKQCSSAPFACWGIHI